MGLVKCTVLESSSVPQDCLDEDGRVNEQL